MIIKLNKKARLFLVFTALFLCLTIIFGMAKVGENFLQKNKKPIYSVARQDKKISISFDCAWGVDYTDEILSVMQTYKVKCTFFMVEFWAKKYPDYVKKIIEQGHEIGTHSCSHKYMSKLTKSQIELELKQSCDTIESISGKKVTLFRPPYGDYNNQLIEVANSLNIKTIQWSIDTLDWKNYSADKIAQKVIKKANSGAIILCHNNGLHTAKALPKIFEVLISQGYTFVPIGELVYEDNYHVDVNGIQRLN